MNILGIKTICDLCGEVDLNAIDHEKSSTCLGHGDYSTTDETLCLDCAISEGVVCCYKQCSGDCTKDEWDEEVYDLFLEGKCSLVDLSC